MSDCPRVRRNLQKRQTQRRSRSLLEPHNLRRRRFLRLGCWACQFQVHRDRHGLQQVKPNQMMQEACQASLIRMALARLHLCDAVTYHISYWILWRRSLGQDSENVQLYYRVHKQVASMTRRMRKVKVVILRRQRLLSRYE